MFHLVHYLICIEGIRRFGSLICIDFRQCPSSCVHFKYTMFRKLDLLTFRKFSIVLGVSKIHDFSEARTTASDISCILNIHKAEKYLHNE
jgi:hypothetical protein